MNVVLGTAQFGLDYGMTNQVGRVDGQEALAIAHCAWENGVKEVDTASLYGTSEKVIGDILQAGFSFRVITKTCKFSQVSPASASLVFRESFEKSLGSLHQESVYGLLIHDCQDLQRFPLLWDEMRRLRDLSLVQKIGVSIYDPSELKDLLRYPDVDIVQLPLNVFDQRFLEGGLLVEMRTKKIEIHVRSIFLQGVLLQGHDRFPQYFSPVREKFMNYFHDLNVQGFDPLFGAIAFIKSIEHLVDSVVIGFVSEREARDVLVKFKSAIEPVDLDFAKYAINLEKYVKPSWWPEKSVFWG